MKRPFLHIFIFFSLGIIFSSNFIIDISFIKIFLLISICVTIMLSLVNREMRHIKHTFLISIFLIGILITNYNFQRNKLVKLYDKEVKAIGVVKEVLKKEEDYEKYVLFLEKINYKQKTYVINEKLIFNIYEETELELGDRVATVLEIKEPNRNTNPKLFNYRRHLESKKIFATSSSKQNTKIINRKNFTTFEKFSIKSKEHVVTSLDKSLNENNANIIKSILLGDDSFLDEENISNFRKLGLAHILAVSGLHIGIIFGFLIFIFDLLKLHRRISMIIAVLIIWIYSGVIGFPPSVLRASLMFSLLCIGRIIYKRNDPINTLSFAGFIMLTVNPMGIYSVSFQLSFIATFTILFFLSRVEKLLKIKNKRLKSSLAIILTAQIGVLPISVYYFNEVQVLSILANLIVAPILTIGIIIGFLIIIASLLSFKIGIFLGFFANNILDLSDKIIELLSKMSSLNIYLSSPSIMEIFLYYLVIFLLLNIIDIKKFGKRIQNCIYINFFISIALGIILYINQEEVKLEFIDVGQGDACLVRFKDKNLLIDTGGNIFGDFDLGENILLPYLRKTGVKTIDGVFLSHFHADHVKGILPLFGEINLKNIFIGYENQENELYNDIAKASKYHKVPINIIQEGDRLKLDKVNFIRVLHPSKESNHDNENDMSLVFILSIYNREILFTGDIEERSEDYIISNNENRDIDIMKVPHHGSKTSSKEELIKKFNPKVAIIQLGKNNFGHPNEDILNRYLKNKTHIFRNDISGLISVDISKNEMSFKGYLKEQEMFVYFLKKNNYIFIYALYIATILLMMIEYKDKLKKSFSIRGGEDEL